MTEQNIKRASLAALRRMKSSGQLHGADTAPEGEDLGAEFWEAAGLVQPKSPHSVHLKLDPEVFDYFKGQGKGHITKMQDVLKAYVKAHQQR